MTVSKWSPVTTDVPHESDLGLVLLNIFISNTDSGIKCTLSKFADIKLSGMVDMIEGRETIQSDLDKIEIRAHVNLMKFYKSQ